jgi:NAD(P)-dependent dehydrogenase (short-subunit alcohol dehydrogenase family)
VGRVVLVTGGNRGIGLAIARSFQAQGDDVAVTVRGEPVEGLTSVRCDMTDAASIDAAVAEVERQLGPVQVLVANATGPQPMIAAAELTWQDHLDQLLFFVKSPTLLMQATLPGMTARGDGRIIQIGSDAFERALPGMSAYNAAKGAQISLTRTWARELGQFGITVNLVAPGWIPVERHAGTPPESLAGYRAEVPLGRMGTPAEIADVVAFVASSASRFVTGERITVNGGHTMD